jgi:hypothetical protein
MVGASAKVLYGKFNLGILGSDQLQQQSINHMINSNFAKWMS